MTREPNPFGKLLLQTREDAQVSRAELAQRVGLDPSYIYRLETEGRRPSRETALALAEALEVDGETVNTWLMAAGYAPLPLLTRVRGAIRTRGSSPGATPTPVPSWGAAARWLEAMGLQEATVGQLLQALEVAGPQERHTVTRAVAEALTHCIDRLMTPVRTAVIPAAGGQHRLFAQHVMQRLLLRAIQEAVESGIGQIVLILAPGLGEPLYAPLKAALDLAIVPPIDLRYCEQATPAGLGDALLQAEALLGQAPFAVLLPDDIVRERTGRTTKRRELRRMLDVFHQLSNSHLVAITRVPRARMARCGVVQTTAQEVLPTMRPIAQLVERPPVNHAICRSPQAFGIVGRYVLQPSIFAPLRALQAQGQRPVQLTDALEQLRRAGHAIYACELAAARQDVGEMFGHASDLIGEAPEQSAGTGTQDEGTERR